MFDSDDRDCCRRCFQLDLPVPMSADCDYTIGREKVTFQAVLTGLCKEQKSEQTHDPKGVHCKAYVNEDKLKFYL